MVSPAQRCCKDTARVQHKICTAHTAQPRTATAMDTFPNLAALLAASECSVAEAVRQSHVNCRSSSFHVMKALFGKVIPMLPKIKHLCSHTGHPQLPDICDVPYEALKLATKMDDCPQVHQTGIINIGVHNKYVFVKHKYLVRHVPALSHPPYCTRPAAPANLLSVICLSHHRVFSQALNSHMTR
jgi:hypothetical protein